MNLMAQIRHLSDDSLAVLPEQLNLALHLVLCQIQLIIVVCLDDASARLVVQLIGVDVAGRTAQ